MARKIMHNISSWRPESESDLEYFRGIPWCAQVICIPGIKPYTIDFPMHTSRGADPIIHGFMFRDGGILRHSNLVAPQGLFPELEPEQLPLSSRLSGALNSYTTSNTVEPVIEVPKQDQYPVFIDLFTLGSVLQGFPGTLYSGIVTLLADGVCGRIAWVHRDPTKQFYTAYTNVRFMKPITFGRDGLVTILIKSQISRRLTTEGKIVVIAVFEGSNGSIHAVAESMVVEKIVKGKL